VPQKNVVPFYLFFHPKKFGNFWSPRRVDLSIYNVCPKEEKLEKFKLLDQPTRRCVACSHSALPGPPISHTLHPLTLAPCHLPSTPCRRPTCAVPSSAGQCREHMTYFPFSYLLSLLSRPYLNPTGECWLCCTSGHVRLPEAASQPSASLWLSVRARDPHQRSEPS
jgi:hypothetical protein